MKLSSREKKLLIFLGVLAVLGAVVWLAIIPIIDNAGKLNTQKDEANLQLIEAKSKTFGNSELDKKLDDIIKKTQAKLDRYLPTNNLDTVMTFIEDKSRQAGIRITGIRFMTPKIADTGKQSAAVQQAEVNALGKLVGNIDALNAGFLPTQAPAAPQQTQAPSSPEESKPEDMITSTDVILNITGSYSEVEAFVRSINESGKYIPVSGLQLARDENKGLTGEITLRLFNMPMPERSGGTEQTGGSTTRDPFNSN